MLLSTDFKRYFLKGGLIGYLTYKFKILVLNVINGRNYGKYWPGDMVDVLKLDGFIFLCKKPSCSWNYHWSGDK